MAELLASIAAKCSTELTRLDELYAATTRGTINHFQQLVAACDGLHTLNRAIHDERQ
jgi:hypothetical protein